MVFSTHQQWAIDLMEVGQLAKWNNKTRYLLIVINVLLKFAWVVPLRNKFSEEVTKVFSKLLKQSWHSPLTIQRDDGREFQNAKLRALLKKHQIHLFSTLGNTKATKPVVVVNAYTVISTLKIHQSSVEEIKSGLWFIDFKISQILYK